MFSRERIWAERGRVFFVRRKLRAASFNTIVRAIRAYLGIVQTRFCAFAPLCTKQFSACSMLKAAKAVADVVLGSVSP